MLSYREIANPNKSYLSGVHQVRHGSHGFFDGDRGTWFMQLQQIDNLDP
jgi:hypothetical protein